MSHILRKKRLGATSLLVVLGVGMFMIVVVSGIAALSLREQQQTRNTEFSNRALQTAEAGVKAAVQKLVDDPTYQKIGCDVEGSGYEDVVPNNDLNQEITCIEVKNTFKTFEGFNNMDRATQLTIDTSDSPGPKSMQLRWHSKTLDENKNLAQYALPGSGPFYPSVAQYDANKYAASVELTFIYWAKGNFGSSAQTAPQIATVFFTPGQEDKAKGFNGLSNNEVNSKCENQEPNIPNLGEYRCVTNPNSIYGFDLSKAIRIADGTAQNYNFVVRIKPRYANMHFQFTAYDVNNNPIDMKSDKAQIDVTARSGNLYRRIRAEKTVSPSSLESVFDSVLYAGNGANDQANTRRDICKSMVVRSNNSLAPATGVVPCN